MPQEGYWITTSDDLLVAPTVIAEVCYLLSKQAGDGAEVQFLRAFGTGELRLVELALADVSRMAELTHRYADLGLGAAKPAEVVDEDHRVIRVDNGSAGSAGAVGHRRLL